MLTFFRKHYIIKLMTSYFLVISISLVLVGFIITIDFFNEMFEEEETKQLATLDDLIVHSESVSNSVKKCIIGIYNTADYGRELSRLMKEDDEVIKKLDHYLKGFFQLDNNIVDILVLNDNNKLVYYKSSYSNRSVSKRYRFYNNNIVNELNKDPSILLNIYSDAPAYIIDNSKTVISYAANLFDVTDQDANKNPIGKLIINVRNDTFNNILLQNDIDAKNYLYMSYKNTIVYSSNNEGIGENALTYLGDYNQNKHFFTDQIINNSPIFDEQFKIYIVTSTKEFQIRIKKYIVRMTNLILLLLFVVFIMTLFVSRLFTNRLRILLDNINKVRKFNLDIGLKPKSSDEIGQLEEAFSTMCFELNEYINQVYVSEIKTKSAEQAALQMKINPHFLYNTIEILRMKALEQNSMEIAEMLAIMGKIFRWNIKGGNKFVGILEELEFAKLYLNLLFYLKNIDYSIIMDDNVKDCVLPKLIIQPIVENCMHHGFFNRDEGKIEIFINRIGTNVEIVVKDNGVGIEEEKLKKIKMDLDTDINQASLINEQVGIAYVNHRIKLLYGNEFGLDLICEEGQGTSVKMTIPYLLYKEIGKNV